MRMRDALATLCAKSGALWLLGDYPHCAKRAREGPMPRCWALLSRATGEGGVTAGASTSAPAHAALAIAFSPR